MADKVSDTIRSSGKRPALSRPVWICLAGEEPLPNVLAAATTMLPGLLPWHDPHRLLGEWFAR